MLLCLPAGAQRPLRRPRSIRRGEYPTSRLHLGYCREHLTDQHYEADTNFRRSWQPFVNGMDCQLNDGPTGRTRAHPLLCR